MIVEDQMDCHVGREGRIEDFEELDELAAAVARWYGTDSRTLDIAAAAQSSCECAGYMTRRPVIRRRTVV
jgi:hypothetical protein